MITSLDVQYSDDPSTARAAILLAEQWTDSTARWMNVVDVADVAPYQPGEFFRRELPCLRKLSSPLLQAATGSDLDYDSPRLRQYSVKSLAHVRSFRKRNCPVATAPS